MKLYRAVNFSFALACFMAGVSSVTGGSSLFACFRNKKNNMPTFSPYWMVSGRILSAVMHKERLRMAEREAREKIHN